MPRPTPIKEITVSRVPDHPAYLIIHAASNDAKTFVEGCSEFGQLIIYHKGPVATEYWLFVLPNYDPNRVAAYIESMGQDD